MIKSNKDISIKLAKFIKNQRLKKNLTQNELASISKIDYKHIQNLESLKKINDPKLSTLQKLAFALEISVLDIINSIF
ncbi:helix-turn-helix domain-containing protein [Candidatus Margulisiibacteriota bacterium]